jgi:hypothetical protein
MPSPRRTVARHIPYFSALSPAGWKDEHVSHDPAVWGELHLPSRITGGGEILKDFDSGPCEVRKKGWDSFRWAPKGSDK